MPTPAQIDRTRDRIALRLREGRFDELFLEELNWDAPSGILGAAVEDARAARIAQKRGVGVWLVNGRLDGLAHIDRAVGRITAERLLLLVSDGEYTWQWPEPRRSGGLRYTRIRHPAGTSPEDVVQRLLGVRFAIDEEQRLTVLDVRDRLRRSFDVERVSTAFYREYSDLHSRLAGAIQGLSTADDRRWYASVLLNRLMFLYFLQKKGFLDGNLDYLRAKLRSAASRLGPSDYYAGFLMPLFHNAIGSPDDRTVEVSAAVGDVPYLNGGVFADHPLELQFDIKVADAVFASIFAFFDRYRWHLDDRPTAEGTEINPDVLGHIFEQFVNQRDYGAFYTPEDTTGWMASQTIAWQVCKEIAASGFDLVPLVRGDPTRYLAPELFYGHEDFDGVVPPNAPGPDSDAWSRAAGPHRGLPDETIWEAFDRTAYASRLSTALTSGEFDNIDDWLEMNVRMADLAVDACARLDAHRIETLWRRVGTLRILDPTCGSGAFLFAGIDVMERIIEAMLERSRQLGLPDTDSPITRGIGGASPLAIRQCVMIHNLYGADIMEEAIEIARLRLYLALAALTTRRADLKPLPDLDFNLVAGNLLVGVNTVADANRILGGTSWSVKDVPQIRKDLEALSGSLNRYRDLQATDTQSAHKAKGDVSRLAADLRHSLDASLHRATAVDVPLGRWLDSHHPLHYLAAFPEVMLSGGFDVVIGNPPYRDRDEAAHEYSFVGLETSGCPNIFAPCAERAIQLTKETGAFGMVLMYATAFAKEFGPLRDLFVRTGSLVLAANFTRLPDGLFKGVRVRNTIVTLLRQPGGQPKGIVSSTALRRWTKAFRPSLFATLRFARVTDLGLGDRWLRPHGVGGVEILTNLFRGASGRRTIYGGTGALYFRGSASYYVPVAPFLLRTFNADGSLSATNNVHRVSDLDTTEAWVRFVVLASRLGWLWWQAAGDDLNVPQWSIASLPLPMDEMPPQLLDQLVGTAQAVYSRALVDSSIWTWVKNAGKWVEGVDWRLTYEATDPALAAFLEWTGTESAWSKLMFWYAHMDKATGEVGKVKRGAPPFPSDRTAKRGLFN